VRGAWWRPREESIEGVARWVHEIRATARALEVNYHRTIGELSQVQSREHDRRRRARSARRSRTKAR